MHAMPARPSSAAVARDRAAIRRRRPVPPSRRRVDPDRVVGLFCLLALTVAIWLA